MSPRLPMSTGPHKDHDWPSFFRLVSISGVATIATIGNIFTISAIIVDDLLRKKGNSFLVSVTLADLLITALVLPATSVAILAKIENSVNLCRFQYGVGSMSCVSAAIFTAALGVQSVLAVRKLEYQKQQSRGQATMLSVQMMSPPQRKTLFCCTPLFLNCQGWFLSGVIVLVHFFIMPELMLAICSDPKSENDKQLLDSITILGICILVFVFLGGLCFLRCLCVMRAWDKPMPYITARQVALINSNFWNWFFRCFLWCLSIVAAITDIFPNSASPYHQPLSFSNTSPLYSIKENKGVVEENYLTFQRLLVWPAILPACISSIIYALANRDFRRCYIQLFNYCCCKTSVALTRRPRDNLRGGSDVRVHIIPGYNIYSSAAGHCSSEVTATPPRFNTFKCGPLMSCRRDVYEL